ncbi:MAG: DUF924 domain-containing protein [Cytophagales bacterium]|nr:DUF924 domain-containing protein [Rhizobacter sp.]
MNAEARDVLRFWFGDAPPFVTRPEWFRKSDAFDHEIAQRFGPLIEQALRGELMAWRDDAETTLARIIVLDQFTRNVFRNTPRAFAGDPLALADTRALLAAGQDDSLHRLQRLFIYLPLEHAEDLAMQDESLRRFSRLATASPDGKGLLDYAQRHYDIIARFGRFPHRNAILGRASTPEELLFLSQPGSSF